MLITNTTEKKPLTAVILYQLKLIKMLAELTNLNHRAVTFLSRATVNL